MEVVMRKQQLPTIEELYAVLLYKPDEGQLFWRERPPNMFSEGNRGSEVHCSNWNRRYSKKEAFKNVSPKGYVRGVMFNQDIMKHRVIWAMHYGMWPEEQLDHIDHNKLNNKIRNLREVTNQENHRNKGLSAKSKSGITGVYWSDRLNKWLASIRVNGKSKHLGVFKYKEDAMYARKQANKKYGYHENHGTTIT
jgi:hypothetical protein